MNTTTQSTWDSTYRSLEVRIGGSSMSCLGATIAKRDDGSIHSVIKIYSLNDHSQVTARLISVTPQEMRDIAANLCQMAAYLDQLQFEGGAA